MCTITCFPILFLTAPLESPQNVRLTSAGSSTLTFEWDEVPCGSRGGLLHYETELQIAVSGFIVSRQQTTSTTATISGLGGGILHNFQVAAVTSAGRQYSDFVVSQTTGGGMIIEWLIIDTFMIFYFFRNLKGSPPWAFDAAFWFVVS